VETMTLNAKNIAKMAVLILGVIVVDKKFGLSDKVSL
jgi:hypothetical protein